MAKRRKNNNNNDLQLGGQNFQVGHKAKGGRTNSHAELQAERVANTHKPTPLTALFVAAVGLYPLAIGLKILPIPAHSLHAPHWVMTAIGCAVIFAGVAIGLQCLSLAKSLLYKIVTAIMVLAMLTPFAWLTFGYSNLPLFLRIAFGFPFVIIALILLPGGKKTIIANPDGKPMSELLKERRLEGSSFQERKLKFLDNKKNKEDKEIPASNQNHESNECIERKESDES
ncbi:MAG: hypothetical protein QG574_4883 [Cyanobacteriota bacterium erpe_2018_sw_21hr_WHONDRS-SW48-000092_B_bin.40]|nr:hypothetical protein [Cyanobacteriota bacterium erpe_2018_sw_21hr_WHONDRS-SW48-000092_B_bin.40]